MKSGIHPNYVESKIVCACGNVINTKSTSPEMHVETCSSCHPYFTGSQKSTRRFGRAEQFYNKYGAVTLEPKASASVTPSHKKDSVEEK